MKRSTELPSIDESIRRIDELFATGQLLHSPRKRNVVVPRSSAPVRGGTTADKNRPSAPTRAMVLRVPEWNSYPWLIHGFSTRRGGVSTIYRSGNACGDLNLGFTSDDSQANVLENRHRFLQAVAGGGTPRARKIKHDAPLALLRQFHSGLIRQLDPICPPSPPAEPLRGDGWIADQPGYWVGIQTADCLPILVADVRLRVVAAFHAGWRGTLARIAERGVGRLRAEFGSRPEDLTAAIGPGIGACCYSVGDDVRMEFSSQFSYAEELFQEVFDLDPIKEKYPMLFLTARAPGHSNLGPSTHLDLPKANRRQLEDAGVAPARVYSLDVCTACNPGQFFSHRAEHGFAGRMLSVIGVAR